MTLLRRRWPDPVTGLVVNHDEQLGPGSPLSPSRSGGGMSVHVIAAQRPSRLCEGCGEPLTSAKALKGYARCAKCVKGRR